MKVLAFALFALLASPVVAKDVTVTLNDKEQEALRQIFDLALRQGGLRVSGNITYMMQKLTSPPEAPATPVPTEDVPAPDKDKP
jgi:hypothetical protein